MARNLWWSWNPETIRLFRDLDPQLFQSSNHNAFALVRHLAPERMQKMAVDAFLRARVDRAHRELRDYLAFPNAWASTHAAPLRVRPVAYLSAEFGLHESFPIYSGGLGVLAGDHLKSASDLGLPLVAVGLFYRESYFRRRLDRDGVQHAEYVRSAAETLPAAPARGTEGHPLIVEIELSPSETLRAQVWQVHVGRNSLLLLDTDIEGNSNENRQLAARLYSATSAFAFARSFCSVSAGSVRCARPVSIGAFCI